MSKTRKTETKEREDAANMKGIESLEISESKLLYSSKHFTKTTEEGASLVRLEKLSEPRFLVTFGKTNFT